MYTYSYTFPFTFSGAFKACFLAIFVWCVALGTTFPAQAALKPTATARPVFSQGLKLLRKRQFKKAIEKFSVTISRGPTGDNLQALAFYHRGLAHQALGLLDEARSDYSHALKLQTLKDKVLKVVYYNRGLVHDGMKRPNAALADFVSAIDKNPKFSPAYHNLGNVLRKLGRHNQAIENFLKSLKLGNPQPYLTYLGLAMAYEGVGRKKEAIMSLNYALSIRPKFKKASTMLARLTTEGLYTFSTQKTAQNPPPGDNSPIVTGSIPPNTARENLPGTAPPVASFQAPGLRGLVEVEIAQIPRKQYKKLALRGSVTGTMVGHVALIVPGPGLKKARAQRRAPPLPRPKRKPLSGNFKVQLGISSTSAKANKMWFFLKAQHGDLLGGLKPTFQQVNLDKRGIFFRVQVGPFKSLKAADNLCQVIKERAVNCFPIEGSS